MEIETPHTTTKPSQQKRSSLLGYGLAFFFAAAAFFSGMQVGASADASTNLSTLFTSQQQSDADMSLFWKVWQTIDSRFVNATTSTAETKENQIWGAIKGLVESYEDPYTVFLTPKDTEIFESDIAGEFGGVGMEVGMQKNLITVIAPLADSPAEKAGILSGDVLVKINGTSTERMSVDEAVLQIRGPKGTEVKLTIFREGESELLEISIERDTINIPTLKVEEKDGVFIIALYNFSANSDELMADALAEFAQSKSTKLLIDLRGNPGGYLQSAVDIASYFLPTGKVVVRENFGEGKEEEVHRSLGYDLGKNRSFKTAILVDNGSASASEILAGALKEHGVATLVGTHTFGKGSVQELIEMPGGSSLKVTIARWLTPNGKSISDGGLIPDIEVEVTKEDREAKRDPQREAAIKYLKD